MAWGVVGSLENRSLSIIMVVGVSVLVMEVPISNPTPPLPLLFSWLVTDDSLFAKEEEFLAWLSFSLLLSLWDFLLLLSLVAW